MRRLGPEDIVLSTSNAPLDLDTASIDGVLTALGNGQLRELHYWFLMGIRGPAIRALEVIDSHSKRLGRAVDILRREFNRTISVNELAEAVRTSEPAFHRHFRTITNLSPLQFQKQLRLIEARQLMLAERVDIVQDDSGPTAAAWAVITDFSRSQGDKIDFSSIDGNLRLLGDQAFQFVGTAKFSGAAGELRYEYSKNVTLIHDTNGDGAADFSIELSKKAALFMDDFVL